MHLKKLLSREYSVQYTEASLRSLGSECKDFVPALVPSQCYLPDGSNEACYRDENEWNTLLVSLEEKYVTTAAQKEFIKSFHEHGGGYVQTTKEIAANDLEKNSASELLAYYENYLRILNIYSCYLWQGFLLNNIFSEKAKKILDAKNITDNHDKIEAALFAPIQKTGILLLQEKLSHLKKEGVNLSHEDAQGILQEYKWMSCLDLHNNPWEEKQVQDFFDSLTPSSESTMSFDEASEQVKLTGDEKELFSSVREFAFIKDIRDVYRRQGIYNILTLFNEIARRFSLTRSEVAYLSNDEIINWLEKGIVIPKEKIAQRQKGFLIYWEGDTTQVESDREKIEEWKKVHLALEQNTTEIKGMSASRGVAEGMVKIVKVLADIQKVEVGDILVAITTHPDFIPAMQRASAFVTDEGGLTSHAAIVARELGKPCIVGTQNATEVLRDGDRVKVDGEKGIVVKV